MHHQGQYPATRLRRLRQTPAIRALVQETTLSVNQLIMPVFIKHGHGIKQAIQSMPGLFQFSVDQLENELQEIQACGISTILLFGIPEHKDTLGSDSYHENGIIQTAIRVIKKIAPALTVIADVCFCEYTDHGHCGVVTERNGKHDVDNDATLELLAKQAVSFAQAGADIVAPSGMIDGMVYAIRSALDTHGYTHLPILSYSVKYASNMYGPFRDAAEGAPQFGDRRSHQMNFANSQEALRECALDIAEGADMLMVKPAVTYLDVIRRVKDAYPAIPLCAYHVSGEYSMLKAAVANDWINERGAVLETLTAIRRAGADLIITYYAKDAAKWIKESV